MNDDFTRRNDDFSNDDHPPRDVAPASGDYPSDPWSNRQEPYPEKKSGCGSCLMGCGCGCLVLILLLVLGAFLVHAYCLKGVPLKVSPETTVLTEPLKEDGKNVDFFQPVEEMSEPKIGADDNGFKAVLVAYGREMYKPQFVAEFGPQRGQPIGPNREWQYDETCKKLGVAPAAASCVYESPSDYLTLPKTEVVAMDGTKQEEKEKKDGEAEPGDGEAEIVQIVADAGENAEELNRHFRDHFGKNMTLNKLMTAPWTLKEQPKMKDWLDKVGPGLDVVREASMKEHYFVPMVRRNDRDLSLLSVSSDAVQFHDKLVQALHLRAMFRLGENKPGDAWKDMLAALRLSRFLDRMISMSGTSRHVHGGPSEAWRIAEVFTKQESSNAEQLDRMIADLETLPEIADRKEHARRTRYNILEAIGSVGNLPQFLETVSGHTPPPGSAEMMAMFGFDWNVVSKKVNERFDALESNLDEKDPEKLYDILKQRSENAFADMHNLSDEEKGRFFLSALTVSGRSEKIGDLGARGIANLLGEHFKTELRQEAKARLLRAAFALERYKREKKEYPEALDALGLKALEPAMAVRYEKTEAGYILTALDQKIEKPVQPVQTVAEESGEE